LKCVVQEVINQQGHGTAADIWSFGCTIIEMAQGKPPWADEFTHVFSISLSLSLSHSLIIYFVDSLLLCSWLLEIVIVFHKSLLIFPPFAKICFFSVSNGSLSFKSKQQEETNMMCEVTLLHDRFFSETLLNAQLRRNY
jgi:serine/threonine protein kinase